MGISICCLLVEDDADDREIFSLALQGVDAEVKLVTANDGEQALTRFREDVAFLPHCIFIDLNMPRMNGQECLEEIRKINRLKDIPIVMYSTTVNANYVTEALRHGATDFIVKPVTIEALTESIAKIFAKLQPVFADITAAIENNSAPL
ncbi:MAG TPA: response regulator [Ohtaekwangia sp.]|uniref:response regulator n=1 Tax=Ohtaekwangia sp. TaxID=2066019 RepID=UPI002F937539